MIMNNYQRLLLILYTISLFLSNENLLSRYLYIQYNMCPFYTQNSHFYSIMRSNNNELRRKRTEEITFLNNLLFLLFHYLIWVVSVKL